MGLQAPAGTVTVALSDGDLRLLQAIRERQERSPDGRARSLFQVALDANLDYRWAHNRLQRLEGLSLVQVKRYGAGLCLEMWLS